MPLLLLGVEFGNTFNLAFAIRIFFCLFPCFEEPAFIYDEGKTPVIYDILWK